MGIDPLTHEPLNKPISDNISPEKGKDAAIVVEQSETLTTEDLPWHEEFSLVSSPWPSSDGSYSGILGWDFDSEADWLLDYSLEDLLAEES